MDRRPLGRRPAWPRYRQPGTASPATCWRRRRDWQAAGGWDAAHRLLLDQLGSADLIAWERACLDSSTTPAKRGGAGTGPNPTDRGRPGIKVHLLTDEAGLPLVARMGPANRHDAIVSIVFTALVDVVPPIRTPAGRRRTRPCKLHADKAYDLARCRADLRQRRIQARIARRGVEPSDRLGRHRWVVERTFAWLQR